jgi:signal transduction histidine kinase
MRPTFKNLLVSSGQDDAIIKEWKRATFGMTLAYGLIPLTVPLVIGFAAVGVWKMAAAVFGLSLAFLASYSLAGRSRLVLAVNLSISAASLINYYYLIFMHNSDGLYFIIFMIILSGIFLDSISAFGWALSQTAILILIAFFSPEYTVFPNISLYFGHGETASLPQRYFSTVIILCIVSAFLSILFQRYVTDLLDKIKQSHDEKVVLESELLQSQKLESIGLLVSGIAHDFGKGLSSIKSSANLILNKFCQKDDELARYAQNIYDSCSVISNSSNKLLTFARKSNDEMTYLNMHDVIESMTNLLSFMLGDKIKISKDFRAGQSTITGNFSQLQSVLMNLSVNANDAMPQGGTLTFSTRNVDSSGSASPRSGNATGTNRYLEISVSDTGIGIDDSVKGKLFTPFFTTKGPDKGTGLGLSNVRRIVKGHQGIVEFSSIKGKGTTFTIYLPLASKPGGVTAR